MRFNWVLGSLVHAKLYPKPFIRNPEKFTVSRQFKQRIETQPAIQSIRGFRGKRGRNHRVKSPNLALFLKHYKIWADYKKVENGSQFNIRTLV